LLRIDKIYNDWFCKRLTIRRCFICIFWKRWSLLLWM
jgi:hypothetical protein